jgi:serine/threonine protein phosphatase PrpC
MVIDTGIAGLDQLSVMSSFWWEVYKEVDENLAKFEYEGSTGTTLMIWKFHDKRYLQCANVGDSTAYISINGDAVPISEDHNLKLKSERNRITELGIKLEPTQLRLSGLSVTRAFGDHFVKDMSMGLSSQPYISTLYEIGSQHSRVILASDGLWDIISGQQAFDMIKDMDDKEATRKLLKHALSSKECVDNVTLIVFYR